MKLATKLRFKAQSSPTWHKGTWASDGSVPGRKQWWIFTLSTLETKGKSFFYEKEFKAKCQISNSRRVLAFPAPLSDAHARDALSKFETQKCWQEWTAFSLTHVELREGAVRVSLEDKASILPRWCQQRMPTDDKWNRSEDWTCCQCPAV